MFSFIVFNLYSKRDLHFPRFIRSETNLFQRSYAHLMLDCVAHLFNACYTDTFLAYHPGRQRRVGPLSCTLGIYSMSYFVLNSQSCCSDTPLITVSRYVIVNLSGGSSRFRFYEPAFPCGYLRSADCQDRFQSKIREEQDSQLGYQRTERAL